MAVGDLEGKIGELNGQLRTLAPILDELGKKVSGMGERVAEIKENLKQVWHQIGEIKKEQAGGSKKWWQLFMTVVSAVIGALVTYAVMKLTKGTP